MDKKALRALEKQRKRVARLRRKRKFTDAIELQRAVCEQLPREANEWNELAAIGREANRLQITLAARFEAAKASRCGAGDWLRLAEEAAEWGFETDALEARFRAADACAINGDFRHALTLLDQVLEAAPGHPQARRIRRLVASRLPPETSAPTVSAVREAPAPPPAAAEPAAEHKEDDVTPEHLPDADLEGLPDADPGGPEAEQTSDVRDTMSYVGTRPLGVMEDGGGDELLIEEVTSPGWTPSAIDLGSERDPTPAGYVCNVQPWPTVLDTRTLTFIGSTEVLGTELEGLTETIEVAEGAPVYLQGHAGQLLYTVQSGTVAFGRERGGHHDLGTVGPGYFFGELGALMGLPSTATATTLEPCLLRVVSRKQIQQQVERANRVPPLISMLRGWYLETVLHICPLFLGSEPVWPEGDEVHWVTTRPGEHLAEPGHPGPLQVIVTGFARITYPSRDGGKDLCIGYLCPGDLCGELDPSPVAVVAESVVTVVSLPRTHLDQLSSEARTAFEERLTLCRTAIEDAISAAQVGGELVLGPQDLFGDADSDTDSDADDTDSDDTDSATATDGSGSAA